MFHGRSIRDRLAPLGMVVIFAGCLLILQAIKNC